MTNITWPDGLPDVLILDGQNADKKNAVLRTEMDAGPAKQRRRYTIATKDFNGSIVVNETQRKKLETWFDNVIAGGALRFLMKDPQTLEYAEFRFKQPYKEDSLDGNWRITMILEKMNA